MKLSTIINASPALQTLIRQKLPLKEAYAVMQLASKLNPMLEFYTDELTKGRTPEELGELEISPEDIKAPTPRLRLDLDLSLTPSEVWALSPFVTFYTEFEEAAT